jgi:hypothetical protein
VNSNSRSNVAEEVAIHRSMAGMRRDAIAVAAAGILASLYVTQLGFYSDDWAFMATFTHAADRSLWGLFKSSYGAQYVMRPLQVAIAAAHFRVFGGDALGPQLVNAAILIAGGVLFYASVRIVSNSRLFALMSAVLYLTVPSYSTDRVWFSAFAITFSATACLLNLFAGLIAMAGRSSSRRLWIAICLLAVPASGLAYEVPFPMLLVNAGVLLWFARSERGGVSRSRAVAYVVVGGMLLLFCAVTAFKLRTTTIASIADSGASGLDVASILRNALRRDVSDADFGLNVWAALRIHFGTYGAFLPLTLRQIAPHVGALGAAASLAMAVGTYAYLSRVPLLEHERARAPWVWAIAAGCVVFAAGYAIFLTNYNVKFTPTGIGNRAAIAASAGAALLMAGWIGLAATFLPRRPQRAFVGAALAALAGGYTAIDYGLASFWIDAYAQERSVLNVMQNRVASWPSGATVLLGGTCPYVGPAIVFESDWDLEGALRILYRDPTLRADVVSDRLGVDGDGISSRIYGSLRRHYAYEPRLLLFEYPGGRVMPIESAAAARSLIDPNRNPHLARCPPGYEGVGVPVFRW